MRLTFQFSRWQVEAEQGLADPLSAPLMCVVCLPEQRVQSKMSAGALGAKYRAEHQKTGNVGRQEGKGREEGRGWRWHGAVESTAVNQSSEKIKQNMKPMEGSQRAPTALTSV